MSDTKLWMESLSEAERVAVSSYLYLNQSAVWINVDKDRIKIPEMSLRYKQNCVAWLERRAAVMASRFDVGRLLVRLHLIEAGVRQTVPCVQCEGLDGDGTMRPHEWAHGQWHGVGPTPGSEAEAALERFERQEFELMRSAPVEWLRTTRLHQSLVASIEAGIDGPIG